MAASDAKPIPIKNQAYRITLPILDADGDLVTGATGLDSEVSIDGGTFADCASEATEIATASGMYYLDLTSGEMNGDTIAIIVKTTSSGAKTTPIVLNPQEADDIRVSVTHWSSTAIASPDTAGYPKVTIKDGTGAGEIDTTSGGVLVAAYASGQAPLQPTVAGRTLDVAATGEAGLDFDNIKDATGAHTLTNITMPTVTTAVNLTTNNDKTGYRLSATGIQDIWDALTSALTTVGSIGKRIADNLDATISSRSTYAGGDTSGTTTLLSRLTATRASNLDFLTGDAYARLGAPAGASVSADIAAVQADTDNIQTRLPAALVGGRMDSSAGALAANVITAASMAADAGAEIADAVWDEAIAGHLGAGSTGAALNAAGSAGDPWVTPLPGAYGAGTAGKIVGDNLDTPVSSRATPAQVNTEVVDALTIDTYAEPGSVPAATSSMKDKLGWLFTLARNKRTTTSTTDTVRNDTDNATIGSSAISDDGTTFIRGEYS